MSKEALIDSYFEGTLTANEQAVFENLLATDAEFAGEVAFQKSVKKQLHLQKRTALKAELRGFEPTQKRVIPLNWQWLSAAAVLALGICTWVFLQKNEPKRDLYTAYYQPFPNVEQPTVRGENEVSEKAKALTLYDAENYAAALPLFEQLYQQDSADYSYFYQGICQLELGNTEKAIALFENVVYHDTVPWENVTDWYLALAYLKNNENEKARQALQKVIAADDFMARQAKELVAKL